MADDMGLAGDVGVGPRDVAHRSGVFSVNVDGFQSPSASAEVLEANFGLLTRPGMRCAPLAHQTIGTHLAGTCRLGFGPFTTEAHVRAAAEALVEVARRPIADCGMRIVDSLRPAGNDNGNPQSAPGAPGRDPQLGRGQSLSHGKTTEHH